MAPNKKETLLEQCTGVIAIGNGIAVHILEYLSIVKEAPHGFREMAIEFVETSRALFPAKAGLARSSAKFQPDVTAQLSQKFQLTKNAFIVLDQVVNKFLGNEKKQTFGKFGKGFRMMFADSEIEKLRLSLNQCKAELSISTLMFSSLLGNDKVDAATAIGYTALAAILGIPDPTVGSAGTQQNDAYASLSPDRRELPPTPGQLTFAARDSSLPPTKPRAMPIEGTQPRYPDTPSSAETSRTTNMSYLSDRSSVMMQPGDNGSDITSLMSMVREQEDLTQFHDRISKQAIRIKLDPAQMHRRAPSKRSVNGTPESARNALVSAMQQKDHKMVEHLLDSGVPPEQGLLKEALITHDLGTVRLFLLYGADPNARDKDGSTPLYTATGSSFYEAATLLVKYGGDSNISTGPYGESPFAVSLTNSKAHFAQLYLQHGADPNADMGNGETAFTQSMNKHTPATLVELMLVYEADPNKKNARGETPLFKAITAERHDLVTYLLEHGADANMPGPKIVLWPAVHQPNMLSILLEHKADLRRAPGLLELATSINSRKAIDILLKYGADPNAKKDGIYTPLCSAIRDNHEDLVDIMLAAGADPNLPALEHPTYKCVTYHRTHMLPIIVAAGADLHKPKGLIEHAVQHNDRDALVYLIDHKVDINARSVNTGHTALTTAIRENKLELIDFLLCHGADPGVRGQEWPIAIAVKHPEILAKLLPYIPTTKIIKGALEMAVVADQLESVKLLLAKGVDVEEKNGGVFSPLTTSIRENRKEIFRFLVDQAGADPNSPGEHLPIIKAIRRHREDDMSYIQHLLTKGADINLMYRGWNAVLQALDNGDLKILQLLAREGHPDLSARGEDGRSVAEVMHERGLDEEEKILKSGGGESSNGQRVSDQRDMKHALSSLRELVL
ncbi:putative ankyrin repeat protein [Cercospora beticola]|uniref:Putative ankyrin repeat protein n=1 Tax=Cercospora beticola TaxID=122368 RepID=A0A2G5HLK9_CERBT|nr:putative ankyrin repeat protein [Cercospora beticola]PIA93113.1 putative ankyrin repeat protein [Cercospora beticola]WPB01256.1 hypothetical protein RHO25_005879 [Cercospora beticola]CAK1363981.1 unnamed protein product [Cercospora beticola]